MNLCGLLIEAGKALIDDFTCNFLVPIYSDSSELKLQDTMQEREIQHIIKV